jgi:phosphoglycolate phosphatase
VTDFDRVGDGVGGTLLLDLDGTLIDSVPDLAASVNRIMTARGLELFTEAELAVMVGDGAPALVARVMAARGREAGPADLDAFLEDYTAHAADRSRPYPGVTETLAALQRAGWLLAVCTNKPEQPARVVLEALGLLPYFAAVGGGDSFAVRKPDPRHLLATLEAAGGGRAVMVGDHRNDVLAASGAGLPCIFALWGYGKAAMGEGAAATASRFEEVPRIAAGLLGSR